MIKSKYNLILLIIILSLTGCTHNENYNANLVDNQEEINIDDFFNLKECIVEYDFTIEKAYEDFYLYAEGKYDLNDDRKLDLIEIELLGRQESTIKINNTEIQTYTDHPFDVYLVDFIADDGFIELAIYDEGPSADPVTTFYRYDGKNIYELGSLYAEISMEASSDILTDGAGTFIEIEGLNKFISPQIVKGYYRIEGNQFAYYPLDFSRYLNKEYTITRDFKAYFIEANLNGDFIGQDIEFTWDTKEMEELKKDEKIKIISHEDFWYGIELQDGTTGILYFWLGD